MQGSQSGQEGLGGRTPASALTSDRPILIVSLGASPSVVTETLWALARQAQPFWPQELHLVTTAGARDIEALAQRTGANALEPGPKLAALSREFGLPAPRVWIHVPQTPGGAVGDIRTLAKAVAFGDCIAEVVRQATAAPDAKVHLSIAGGRKTMSYHAGAAMTLYGRAQDEVSHVLIRPAALEGCRDFWWPSPEPCEVDHGHLRAADGTPLKFSAYEGDVHVELIRTPFFRARRFLTPEALAQPISYGDLVEMANLAIAPPRLSISLDPPKALVGSIDLRLGPSELALYAFFAERARLGLPPLTAKQLRDATGGAKRRFEEIRWSVPTYTPGRRFGAEADLGPLLSRTVRSVAEALVQPELLARFGLRKTSPAKGAGYAIDAGPEDIALDLTPLPALQAKGDQA